MKVVVIGSGVSGLSCCYQLAQNGVSSILLEKEPVFGGHAYTHAWQEDGCEIKADCGFLVYNNKNYPMFSRLLSVLGVDTCATNMSFAYDNIDNNWSYLGGGFLDLWKSRNTAFNPRFYLMLLSVLRFNYFVNNYVISNKKTKNNQLFHADMVLVDLKNKIHLSESFWNHYLVPMLASIWTCSPNDVCQMPLKFVLGFMHAHGLTKIINRPKWRTLSSKSESYVKKILQHNLIKSFKNVSAIVVNDGVASWSCDGADYQESFSALVLACHPQQSVQFVSENNPVKKYLQQCVYNPTHAVLHRDQSMLPKNNKIWGSWNYIFENNSFTASYWLNSIQKLDTKMPVVLTINPKDITALKDKITELEWEHPNYNSNFLAAVKNIEKYQGTDLTYFVGAYLGYGFHEDGCRTGYESAKMILRKYYACNPRYGAEAFTTQE
jgi:uncharacterized protein